MNANGLIVIVSFHGLTPRTIIEVHQQITVQTHLLFVNLSILYQLNMIISQQFQVAK